MNEKNTRSAILASAVTVLLILSICGLNAYHDERQPQDIIPTMHPGMVSSNLGYISYDVSGNITEVSSQKTSTLICTAEIEYVLYADGMYYIYLVLGNNRSPITAVTGIWINSDTMAPADSTNLGKESVEVKGLKSVCDVYLYETSNAQLKFYIDSSSKVILKIDGKIISASWDTDRIPIPISAEVIMEYSGHALKRSQISEGKTGETVTIPLSGKETVIIRSGENSEEHAQLFTGHAEITTVSSIKGSDGYDTVVNITISDEYGVLTSQYFELDDLQSTASSDYRHTSVSDGMMITVPEYKIQYDGKGRISVSGIVKVFEYGEGWALLKETVKEFSAEGTL